MASYDDGQPAAYHLKHQTAENHLALEAIVQPRLLALQNKADYETLLRQFYGFFKPLEVRIAEHITPHLLPDIAARRSTHLIVNDLTFLNPHASVPPLARQIPEIADAAAAFGALYVLEGSTLGGRGITRLLLKNEMLQLQPAAVQYFNGYGEQTGPMWTTFVTTLNQYAAATGTTPQLVATANNTFALFKEWLQK